MGRNRCPRYKCQCSECGWKGIRSDRMMSDYCPRCGKWNTVKVVPRLTKRAVDGCKAGQHLVLSGSNKCVVCGERVNRRN